MFMGRCPGRGLGGGRERSSAGSGSELVTAVGSGRGVLLKTLAGRWYRTCPREVLRRGRKLGYFESQTAVFK